LRKACQKPKFFNTLKKIGFCLRDAKAHPSKGGEIFPLRQKSPYWLPCLNHAVGSSGQRKNVRPILILAHWLRNSRSHPHEAGKSLMRVVEQRGLGGVSASRAGRAGASQSGARFSVDMPSPQARAEAQAPVSILGGIDALLLIREQDQQKERRRRSVRRGQGMLDVLDELKLGVLSGRVPADLSARLRLSLRDEGAVGDPALDSIVEAIELRAEVELAKLKQAQNKAASGEF
jgi:Class II flagellar assembly regulator